MTGYDADFYRWTQEPAQAIAEGRWSEIDRVALADEVELWQTGPQGDSQPFGCVDSGAAEDEVSTREGDAQLGEDDSEPTDPDRKP